jgi:hypothetical protein
MSDLLRVLNPKGIESFAAYLQLLRDGSAASPPLNLLFDDLYSQPLEIPVPVQMQEFSDSFEFGQYLSTALKALNRREIAFNHALWSWLALYFLDQICPVVGGKRPVLEDAVYILSETYNHRR